MRRWILGAKNTYVTELALDHISAGGGAIFIDPTGDAINLFLAHSPLDRRADVILFDPSDYEWPVALNFLADVKAEHRAHTATLLLDAFRASYKYTNISTPDFNLTLYSCLAALLDAKGGNLLGIKYLLTNSRYRDTIKRSIKDIVVKDLWNDFEELDDRNRQAIIKSTRSNISLLIADPRIRNVIGQTKSAFKLPKVIKDKKILLVRLPTAKLGKVKVSILGSMLLAQLTATEGEINVYVADCHRFDGQALIDLAEDPRFNLTAQNTYLDELSDELQAALFGHMDERTIFRVGIEDGERLHKTIPHDNNEPHLYDLAPYQARIFPPNKTGDFPPLRAGSQSTRKKVENLSRISYASPRAHVEESIKQFIEGMTK